MATPHFQWVLMQSLKHAWCNIDLEIYIKKTPTIIWVMFHDRTDGPAVADSPETEQSLLPTANILLLHHIQPQQRLLKTAVVQQAEDGRQEAVAEGQMGIYGQM